MITLNASGGSITFEFSGNSTYLNDGTITVPVNSLALIIDESNMATFRKAASNDIFVSANIAEFGMTKDELIVWFKENAIGSTGGGGGITSGEVQTMIDESISGKADSSDVYTTGQTSGATEIANALNAKLDATAYTPTVVDAALNSGSTNPVQNQALYSELRIENAPVETTLTFRQPIGEDDYWTTNYPSGCTTLVGNILAYTTQIELYNNSSDLGGFIINCYDGVLDSVSFWGIEGTYSISGSVVTISYPNTTNVTRLRIRKYEYQPDYQTYKAMATVAPTVLKNQVNDNTTALGGLKLQQISQSDYENLQTKDSSTLYIII